MGCALVLLIQLVVFCTSQLDWMYHQGEEEPFHYRLDIGENSPVYVTTTSTAKVMNTPVTEAHDHEGVLEIQSGNSGSLPPYTTTVPSVPAEIVTPNDVICPKDMTVTELYKCVPDGMHLRFNNLTHTCPPCPLCPRRFIKCNCKCPACVCQGYQADQKRSQSSADSVADEIRKDIENFRTDIERVQKEIYVKIDKIAMKLSTDLHRQLSSGLYQIKQLYKSLDKHSGQSMDELLLNLSTIVDRNDRTNQKIVEEHVDCPRVTKSILITLATMTVLLFVYGFFSTYGAVYFYRLYREVSLRQVDHNPAPNNMAAEAVAAFQGQQLHAAVGDPEEGMALQAQN